MNTRKQHYTEWDGKCASCGHDYFECRGNCTCLSCNAQRQDEIREGHWFDEDGPKDQRNIEWREAQAIK